MRLTAKRVLKALKAPGRYADGDNLYLQVSRPGKASWLLRYARDGRERMLGLGPLHTVGLAEARERAKRARLQLLDGVDPLAAKQAQRAQEALQAARAITFEEAARTWYAQHQGSWKNAKHAAQVIDTLATFAFPKIGNLPVNEIDTGLVLKCIEPDWATTTETMSRVRGRIESVLDWATVRNYRQGDNPARWRGHLAEVLPAPGKIAKPEHHAALPYAQVPAFMADLRKRPSVTVRALEFTIITAARTGEVLQATWDEIDFADKTWVIPEGRMKGGKQHRVPLTGAALEILAALPREEGNPHVFIGSSAGAGLHSMAMARLLRGIRIDCTVHGFRSSFRDWAGETTNFPNHVVEMALAHAIGSAVEASYRRGDLFSKRRKLMEAWAAYCSRPAVSGETVVPLRARARARAHP